MTYNRVCIKYDMQNTLKEIVKYKIIAIVIFFIESYRFIKIFFIIYK